MTYNETIDNKEEKKRRYQEYYEKGLKDARESMENDEDKRGTKEL